MELSGLLEADQRLESSPTVQGKSPPLPRAAARPMDAQLAAIRRGIAAVAADTFCAGLAASIPRSIAAAPLDAATSGSQRSSTLLLRIVSGAASRPRHLSYTGTMATSRARKNIATAYNRVNFLALLSAKSSLY